MIKPIGHKLTRFYFVLSLLLLVVAGPLSPAAHPDPTIEGCQSGTGEVCPN